MTDNFQLVPLPIPAYLAQFLAFKLKTTYHKVADHLEIDVQRYSYFGRLILSELEAVPYAKPAAIKEGEIFLRISNHSGNEFRGTPRGATNLLALPELSVKKLQLLLKTDFEDACIIFVNGATFAHTVNGWYPSQKRKGVQKAAIMEFCKVHQVDLEEKSFTALMKMCQRHKNNVLKDQKKTFEKFSQAMSF